MISAKVLHWHWGGNLAQVKLILCQAAYRSKSECNWPKVATVLDLFQFQTLSIQKHRFYIIYNSGLIILSYQTFSLNFDSI